MVYLLELLDVKVPQTKRPAQPSLPHQSNITIVVSTTIMTVFALGKPMLRILNLVISNFGENERELYLYLLISEMAVILNKANPLVTMATFYTLSSQFRSHLRQMISAPCGRCTSQER